ncbi:uncharacterized protein [Mytilus edulis]|uniref:uncharacterized protein n=1 Tax=Mytilus edulis TaxID=6550 RepID=UPI0039EE2048
MNIVGIMIVIHCVRGTLSLKTMIAQHGESCIFICPYKSTTKSVLWFGPRNLVSYTKNWQINTDIERQHRIRIVGNTSIGEFNLAINNLSRIDYGLYRCASIVNGRSVTSDFMLKILQKPTISNDQSRLQLSSEVGKITIVSLQGFAFPSPTSSWMSSSGGQLGTWAIAYTSGEFRATSTILPTRRSHINEYKALIRNTVGSFQILINLHVYEPKVTIEPRLSCNTSDDISLTCYINTNDSHLWENTWKHYQSNVLIRNYEGNNSSIVSVWKIRYCDYQDAGEYVCSWTYNQTEVTATSVVVVYGTPIISKQDNVRHDETRILSVEFFTSSLPIDVDWYINGKHMEDSYSSSLKIANVTLISYGKTFPTVGYRNDFVLPNSYERQRDISYRIKNQYDSVEGAFVDGNWNVRMNEKDSTGFKFTKATVSAVSLGRQSKGKLICCNIESLS